MGYGFTSVGKGTYYCIKYTAFGIYDALSNPKKEEDHKN